MCKYFFRSIPIHIENKFIQNAKFFLLILISKYILSKINFHNLYVSTFLEIFQYILKINLCKMHYFVLTSNKKIKRK